MKGTWQTTDSGSGGTGAVAAVILGAVVLAAVAGPVVAAAVELVHIVAITVAVLLALAAVAGGAVVALRLRQRRPNRTTRVSFPRAVPQRGAQALSEPRPGVAALPAPGRPAEVHLHFHGVSAEDVAAIIASKSVLGTPSPDDPGS